ncbi:hypothetical protein [Chelatococcus reniformis]|uniref:Antibiotic ABC transporter n=1 Tax=Chelatococcus reniformis TaxID=1494448 RepID=A0A916XL11_9HYPH|nr:hypothetical protein [Chelatococcus reniformis]GGC78798.1 hypothetical protein GCM10010994_41190 [Chelatococcus reniformis]
MFDLFDSWVSLTCDTALMALGAQQVIGLRLVKMAAGGTQAEVEMQRMVAEKSSAFVEAQLAMLSALAAGQSHRVAAVALTPYARRVRANHARLSRS